MQGNVLEQTGGSGGDKVNGIIAEYTAGGSINSGDFVKLNNNLIYTVTSDSDTILGVAKNKGLAGNIIKVYVSEVA